MGLIGVWNFAATARCRRHRRFPPGGRALPPFTRRRSAWSLHAAETESFAALAKALAVPLNDLLARDLFLALEDRRQHAPEGPRLAAADGADRFRSPADFQLPAANVVSMVFLDRRSAETADRERLLQGITAEMRQIKRFGLGFDVRDVALGRAPFARRAVAAGCARRGRPPPCCRTWARRGPTPRCRGKTAASCWGRGARIDRRRGPLARGTHTAFSVFTYAGRFCITLHYDPRAISPAAAAALLDAYARRAAAVRPSFIMTALAVVIFWLLAVSIGVQALMSLWLLAALLRGRRGPSRMRPARRPSWSFACALRPVPRALRPPLLDQDYPQYDVRIVIDGPDDPAWRALWRRLRSGNVVVRASPPACSAGVPPAAWQVGNLPHGTAAPQTVRAGDVRIETLTPRRPTCSLKCSSLVQVVAQLDHASKWSPCWMPTPSPTAPGSASWSPRWPIRGWAPPPATAGTCRRRRAGPAWSAISGTRPPWCKCSATASPGAAPWR